MKTMKILCVLVFIGIVGAAGFLYSGIYPMGADVPHSGLTYWALETLRERSIAVRARDISVPTLDQPELLLTGGADYNEMCASCHLKPGKSSSEISQGLYPQPPNLAKNADEHGHDHGDAANEDASDAARQFWIIKHGIKASGMAAFGATHDDDRIWAMVAFLQKLPTLSPAQYQVLTARTEGAMEHGHDDASKAPEAEEHVPGSHPH